MQGRKPNLPASIYDYDFATLSKQEPHRRVKLCLLGLAHLQEGKSLVETGRILKTSWISVRNWLARFSQEGLSGLKEKPRSGRKSYLPNNKVEQFKQALESLAKSRSAFPDLLAQIDERIIQASADGAYDCFKSYELLVKRGAKLITIPPREKARIKQHGNSKKPALLRDENIRSTRKIGKAAWKKETGYHRKSMAENMMFRFKKIFAGDLKAILFESQATEAFIKCNVLNTMTEIGMPESYAA